MWFNIRVARVLLPANSERQRAEILAAVRFRGRFFSAVKAFPIANKSVCQLPDDLKPAAEQN